MRRCKILITLLLLALISGCAVSAKVKARNELESSKAAYKSCLQQHTDNPSHCDGLEKAYEADLETFRVLNEALKSKN